MEVSGLPLHPLVVHAAVTLVPLAAVAAWALALAPGWRWAVRWVALLTALGALPVLLLTRASGQALLDERPFLLSPDSAVAETLQTHQDRADVLTVAAVLLAVVVAVAFWLLPAPTGLASGRLDHRGRESRAASVTLSVLLLGLGAVVLVWVVLTGDAGSRAVWGS